MGAPRELDVERDDQMLQRRAQGADELPMVRAGNRRPGRPGGGIGDAWDLGLVFLRAVMASLLGRVLFLSWPSSLSFAGDDFRSSPGVLASYFVAALPLA